MCESIATLCRPVRSEGYKHEARLADAHVTSRVSAEHGVARMYAIGRGMRADYSASADQSASRADGRAKTDRGTRREVNHGQGGLGGQDGQPDGLAAGQGRRLLRQVRRQLRPELR